MLEVGLPRGLLVRVSLLTVGLVHDAQQPPAAQIWQSVDAGRSALVCAAPDSSNMADLARLMTRLQVRSGSTAAAATRVLPSNADIHKQLRTMSSGDDCELLLLADPLKRKSAAVLSNGCYESENDNRLSAWASDVCSMNVSQVLRSTWPVAPAWGHGHYKGKRRPVLPPVAAVQSPPPPPPN